jgi:hypothetical protein
MESIYLSDWFQSHGVIVVVLLLLLQPTDVSFLHSLTQWRKTTWFSTQIMWELIQITCYCKLIIVFFTTGYPHQLRHFLSLLYYQFHPALFPQLSNEVYLPFFQWTLRFSTPPNQPTYWSKNTFLPPTNSCVCFHSALCTCFKQFSLAEFLVKYAHV